MRKLLSTLALVVVLAGIAVIPASAHGTNTFTGNVDIISYCVAPIAKPNSIYATGVFHLYDACTNTYLKSIACNSYGQCNGSYTLPDGHHYLRVQYVNYQTRTTSWKNICENGDVWANVVVQPLGESDAGCNYLSLSTEPGLPCRRPCQ